MTNPTRQQIINAYDALLELQSLAEDSLQSATATIRTLEERIVTVLPPVPRPTMAEVEWDDELHYLAEAEHPIWGRTIMIFQSVDTGNILIEFREDGDRNLIYITPEYLTPTGRRYTLTEVQE